MTSLRGVASGSKSRDQSQWKRPRRAVSQQCLVSVASGSVGDPLAGRVVVVLHPVLVTAHLPVELVHQLVDGGVQVFVRLLDEDVATLDVQCDFSLLASFLL